MCRYFFNILNLCMLLFLITFSACSTNDQLNQSTAQMSNSSSIESQSENKIEKIFFRIKKFMKFDHLYLADSLEFSSRMDLLRSNCRSQYIDISNLIKPGEIVPLYDLDKVNIFSFLSLNNSGLHLDKYTCEPMNDLKENEEIYYGCMVDQDMSKCFSLALLIPENNSFSNENMSIRKSSQIQLCKEPNGFCNFYNAIFPSRETNLKLTKNELVALKHAKANVLKLHQQLEKESRMAEAKEKKKIEIYEKNVSICKSGNAQKCWKLYISVLDTDKSLADLFVSKSCEFGLEKACIVDERNRQIQYQEQKQKMQNEAMSRKVQRANYLREQQVVSEEHQRQIQEANERAQLATGIANAISRTLSPVVPDSSSGKICFGDVNCNQGQKCAKLNNEYEGHCIDMLYVKP